MICTCGGVVETEFKVHLLSHHLSLSCNMRPELYNFLLKVLVISFVISF